MRRLSLIAFIFLSTAAAHAGPELAAANMAVQQNTSVQQTATSSEQLPDANANANVGANALAAKRQAMMAQKMAMQKQRQAAMQREMQLHPIRTRLHFALLRLKQRFHHVY